MMHFALEKSCHTVYRAIIDRYDVNFDTAIEEFGNKKARKISVQKLVVFISEKKIVLIFYTFKLFFPICHFCFLFNCYLQCLFT